MSEWIDSFFADSHINNQAGCRHVTLIWTLRFMSEAIWLSLLSLLAEICIRM